jgi:hypothetical protein
MVCASPGKYIQRRNDRYVPRSSARRRHCVYSRGGFGIGPRASHLKPSTPRYSLRWEDYSLLYPNFTRKYSPSLKLHTGPSRVVFNLSHLLRGRKAVGFLRGVEKGCGREGRRGIY